MLLYITICIYIMYLIQFKKILLEIIHLFHVNPCIVNNTVLSMLYIIQFFKE